MISFGIGLYIFASMRKRVICGSVCGVIFLGVALFTIIGLNSLIDEVILDGVVLAPETYDTWGASPGAANIPTIRNFTMYNFTNPRGYLYRGELAKFTQISNFVYLQQSNFTNLTYSDDKSTINYNFWLYFKVLEQSRDVSSKVNVVNLAPLGFWNQLDLVDQSTFALQGFGGLFVEMNNTIRVQAIGQGVAGQYLEHYKDWQVYCEKMTMSAPMCQWLWQDHFYGLGDMNRFEPWVLWLYLGDSDAGNAIVEYFGFDDAWVYQFGNLFREWCATVDKILDDWYCKGEKCNEYDLTLAQLSKAGLTGNPPTGDAVDSICQSGNITCKGYPQLYAYYKNVFVKDHPQAEYQGLNFSMNTISNLFSPYNGTFLNIGNLSELFSIGSSYDINKTNPLLLQTLIQITHTDSKWHAEVIWEYTKYFTSQFVLKTKAGGIRKHAGLAGIFSQALYESITAFSQWVMPQFLGLLIAEQMGNCTQFILANSDSVTQKQANAICKDVTVQSYKNYHSLASHCLNPISKPAFKSNFNLSTFSLFELCDHSQPSLLKLLTEAHKNLASKYNCSVNPERSRCTPFQLGYKQMLNSQITLNPIRSNIKQYESTLTAKEWNNEFEQFEYRNFLGIVYDDPWFDKQAFEDYERIASILSFDKFYSVPGMQDLLLEKNQTRFQQLYYWNNSSLLLEYIRFIAIEVGFGGISQERTVNELLFGYEDPFLKQLKEMDPMLGGDPSIQAVVMLNQPNSTIDEAKNKPQTMYTGYSDTKLTRNYVDNMGYPYVTYNKTFYTGYEIKSEQTNPYITPEPLHGTDAVQNLPMSRQEDSQFVFIDTLYRIAKMDYNCSLKMFGFDVLKYTLSEDTIASARENPYNANFYQQERGLLNLSFLGVPALVSKNHFLDSDPKWLEKVQMYDESGQNIQLPNYYDDSYLIVEPKTGVTFSATLYLQNSVHMRPDEVLFPQLKSTMLPVMTVFRSANMTQDAADDLLGDLKVALAAPRKILIFSFSGLFFTLCGLCCCLFSHKQQGKQPMPSLLESTQNALQARLQREEDQEEG